MSGHNNLISGKVIRGLGNGKSQSFATVNLAPQLWPKNLAKGVYAAWVLVAGKKYKGALYFGPRKVLQEEQDVLEIHLLNFAEDIYEQKIGFSIEKFIRCVQDFSSFAEMKKQIAQDILEIEKSISS